MVIETGTGGLPLDSGGGSRVVNALAVMELAAVGLFDTERGCPADVAEGVFEAFRNLDAAIDGREYREVHDNPVTALERLVLLHRAVLSGLWVDSASVEARRGVWAVCELIGDVVASLVRYVDERGNRREPEGPDGPRPDGSGPGG